MLEEKINKDFLQAMKDGDAVRKSTLSFLRAQLKYLMIEKKADKLADPDVIAVIKKQAKQRQDSIEQYQQGGRADLADKEAKELDILKSYLPQEMGEEQIRAAISETVKELNATGMKDMGKVMQAVIAKLAGRADTKSVSELVKKALAA
ncbi:MAG: GatB/YqeY domain-containing protein [Candidatus Omnitrophota bacterium]|nr:GatB/YqeY domain-containing protein [Candidatus Omnitrophota bacterium]MDZ4241600.1 GatB/YqeY domain-containing protein [Candidatus Omnitrophota bacterium]